MRTAIFILLFFQCFANYAQLSKAAANIKKIDNKQFIILHNKPANFSMKSQAAHKLIKMGKSATGELVAALNDTSKTIMAHLILCHIWFKHVSFAGPKTLVTNKGDVFKYYLGEEKGEGLLISEIKTADGTFITFIEPDDLEKIKMYWNKKILTQQN